MLPRPAVWIFETSNNNVVKYKLKLLCQFNIGSDTLMCRFPHNSFWTAQILNEDRYQLCNMLFKTVEGRYIRHHFKENLVSSKDNLNYLLTHVT